MRRFDAIVIGGGAAGVMAAGVAAGAGYSVLLCEKMEKPQRKVRITGKGRCNLTNMRSGTEFLNHVHESPEFVAAALRSFSNKDAYAFFERIGVPLAVERGDRVFPVSGKAWDVAEAHIRWCRDLISFSSSSSLISGRRLLFSVSSSTPRPKRRFGIRM